MDQEVTSTRSVRVDGLRIPSGRRVYAVGDVHGRLDLLENLHARIDFIESGRTDGTATEVYLGDVVDRGPDSAIVMIALLKRARTHDVVLLAGNHELEMIRAVEDYDAYLSWLQMGGRATVASFRLEGGRAPETSETHMQWVEKSLPLIERFSRELTPFHTIGGALFVHAGVRPGLPLTLQRTPDLTLIREPFLSSEQDFGRIVVHGHTPVPRIDIRHNRINVDIGAYVTGRLGCVCLEGDEVFVI